MLGVKKNETTLSIVGNWSMRVWHEKAKKIIFSEDNFKHTFAPSFGNLPILNGWGKFISSFDFDGRIQDENNYIVTINISKWSVNKL